MLTTKLAINAPSSDDHAVKLGLQCCTKIGKSETITIFRFLSAIELDYVVNTKPTTARLLCWTLTTKLAINAQSSDDHAVKLGLQLKIV